MKTKLIYKTPPHSSEETTLFKSFKFYDMEGYGYCNLSTFIKTILKIGVTGFSTGELTTIFNFYEIDSKGRMNYKKFIDSIFSKSKGSNIPTNYSTDIDTVDTPKKIRNKILLRGYRGIFSLYGYINSKDIDYSDIAKMNNSLRLGLSNFDIQKMFNGYDVIDFDSFMNNIRGRLNDFRKKIINSAFSVIKSNDDDIRDKDSVDMKTLKSCFNTKCDANKNEDDAYIEFNDTFDIIHSFYLRLYGGNKNKVSYQEFEEYYHNISLYITDDSKFEDLLTHSYKNITIKTNRSVSQPRKRIVQTDYDSIKQKFIKFLKSSSITQLISFITSIKLLSHAAYPKNFIDINTFTKSIAKLSNISRSDIRNIFSFYDTEKEGYINVDYLINDTFEQMQPERMEIVVKAFEALDVYNKGQVDINYIKNSYNAAFHPKVKKGKISLEEEYSCFIDSIDTFHNMNLKIENTTVNKFTISKGELVDYYNYVSFLYDNDSDFISMIQNVWDLPSFQPMKKVLKTKRPSTNYLNRSMVNRPITNVYSIKVNDDPLIALRKELKERGIRGIMSLRRSLMINDTDNTRRVSKEDLNDILNEYRIDVNIEPLFDNKREINYDLLIDDIIGKLPQIREIVLEKVFDKLSKKNNYEYITLDDIRKEFNAKCHPDVRKGIKKEKEILSEFLDLYEYHFYLLKYSNSQYDKERKIYIGDFIKFYSNYSFIIENDDEFENILIGVWQL